MSKNLKTYKITDKKTGETFSVSFPNKPTQSDIKKISELRKKTKRQAEIANAEEEERPFLSKIHGVISAPSEYLAPEPMAQEDVEKLPLGQRVGRLGREFASGITSPENLAVMAPAFTGPLGLAASSIVGGAQMLMNTPEAVKSAYEDPSLETLTRAGVTGLGVVGAGLGLKTGLKGLTKAPKVEPPGTALTLRNKRGGAEPIEAEFVDTRITPRGGFQQQIEARQPKALPPRGPIIPPNIPPEQKLLTGKQEGPIVTPPGETVSGQKLLGGKETPQIEGTYEAGRPFESPESTLPKQALLEERIPKQLEGIPEVTSPIEVPPTDTVLPETKLLTGRVQEPKFTWSESGPIITPAPAETKLLEAYIGNLSKKATGTLLRQRDKVSGREREAIDNILKRRGALPDETEIFPVEGEVKPSRETVLSETSENTSKTVGPKFASEEKTATELMKEKPWTQAEYIKMLEKEQTKTSETVPKTVKVESPKNSEYDPLSFENKKGKVRTKRKGALKEELEPEIKETPKLNEEFFTRYNSELETLISQDKLTSDQLRFAAKLGKDSGLDIETVVNDIIDNTPRVSNNVNKAWAAAKRVFEGTEEAEMGGFMDPISMLLSRALRKSKGTEAEGPLSNVKKELGFFERSLPKPESVIGRMGTAGLKIERAMEDGQFFADSLKGKADILVHDAFKELTPREIGQRIAVLNSGKEIILNKSNFDKYVDWKDGTYKPKKGISQIKRMKGSLSNVVLDGATPANSKIAKAAELFTQAMEILGDEGELSEVSTISSSGKYIPFKKMGMDYWPREYTNGFYESLKKNPKDWNRIIKEVAESRDISLDEAETLLNNKQLYAELTTRGQHQRTLKQDSSIIDPNVIYDHINKFSSRVGMAKALGPEDIRGSLLNTELTKLMNEGYDREFASDTISRLVGREQKNIPGKVESTIQKAVTDLNNARLMTSFIINNLANITTTVARVGEVNTLKGLGAMLGNMEMSRRMATLSGATENLGALERSGSSIGKMLGIPMSERFMRTWADQSGRATIWQLLDSINNVKEGSPQFIKYKQLLDSLLGKDSTETIQKGIPSTEELARAGWQLAKDSQGIVNPATMPPLFEGVNNPGLRLIGNLAMQYKRMAMLGMNSLKESFTLNPTRTIRTLLVTAPIIGELVGDAGSALFGGMAGFITGEGAAKAAMRDVKDRGKFLSDSMEPILQKKLGLSSSQSKIIARYIEDMNRGFALGLIGDLIYSVAFWGKQAGADVVAGGISPAFEFVYDVSKSIMDGAFDILKSGELKKKTQQEFMYNVALPQRIGSSIKRSEKEMKGGSPLVRPPNFP